MAHKKHEEHEDKHKKMKTAHKEMHMMPKAKKAPKKHHARGK